MIPDTKHSDRERYVLFVFADWQYSRCYLTIAMMTTVDRWRRQTEGWSAVRAMCLPHNGNSWLTHIFSNVLGDPDVLWPTCPSTQIIYDMLTVSVCWHHCVAESKEPKELMNVRIWLFDPQQQSLVIKLKQWFMVWILWEVNSWSSLQSRQAHCKIFYEAYRMLHMIRRNITWLLKPVLILSCT